VLVILAMLALLSPLIWLKLETRHFSHFWYILAVLGFAAIHLVGKI